MRRQSSNTQESARGPRMQATLAELRKPLNSADAMVIDLRWAANRYSRAAETMFRDRTHAPTGATATLE
jgi:hypothetical protein